MEIQQLLAEMQKFAQSAVEALQQGDKNKASLFFNIVSSISSQISDECKK
jgi:hypothetical protein